MTIFTAMKIIDLSLPIYSGMPVYPGDPECFIEPVFTLEKDNWNMHRLHIYTHDGTHVNTPSHCFKNGKTISDYQVDEFQGDCILFEKLSDISHEKGVLFQEKITHTILAKLIQRRPKFIGTSITIDENIERLLLQNDFLVYENLNNLEQLPRTFYFSGVPLHIKNGDGSPVRAYAIINT